MPKIERNKEASNIEIIGIPRALLYFRYGVFWERFFEELGFDVVLSEKTTKATLDTGEYHSVDEVCLASKVYLGHVANLLGKCDTVFIPSFASGNVRCGFCTKFQSLPDMVRNTFREENISVLSVSIEDVTDEKKTKDAFLDLAASLGVHRNSAKKAYKIASLAQNASDAKAQALQKESLELMSKYKKVKSTDVGGDKPLSILLVAHPYIAHDEYLSRDITEAIEAMDSFVLYADRFNKSKALKRSFEFSDTLPWIVNRELVGAMLELSDHVDGVVLVSAFPCGPDSMFDDAILRRVDGIPILNLVIDAQSGSAGLQTRIESFIDILRFKEKGGYLND